MNSKQSIYARIKKIGQIPQHAPRLGRCWLWTGFFQQKGYGVVSFESQYMLVHRLVYRFEIGPIEGVQILHKCDNPACCRPSHLFSGNASENMQDMWNKNRHIRPIGMRNNHAKLTDAQVLEIRGRWERRESTQVALAKEFKVHKQSINNIITRVTWKFI